MASLYWFVSLWLIQVLICLPFHFPLPSPDVWRGSCERKCSDNKPVKAQLDQCLCGHCAKKDQRLGDIFLSKQGSPNSDGYANFAWRACKRHAGVMLYTKFNKSSLSDNGLQILAKIINLKVKNQSKVHLKTMEAGSPLKMSEKICPKWNDFKENVDSSFGILWDG